MKRLILMGLSAFFILMSVGTVAAQDRAKTKPAQEAPTVAQQLAAIQEMCTATDSTRAAMQETKSLYDRLGQYDGIHALVVEIVRLHHQNEAIKHYFEKTDDEVLIKHVTDFMAAGTGGPQEYDGLDMTAAHVDYKLTDADFLSAGGDIMKAMQTKEYGQEEISEVLCILMSFKDQVVKSE